MHTASHPLRPLLDAVSDIDANALQQKLGLSPEALRAQLEAAPSVEALSADLRTALGELLLQEVSETDQAIAAIDRQLDETSAKLADIDLATEERVRAIAEASMQEQNALPESLATLEQNMARQLEGARQDEESAEIAKLQATLKGQAAADADRQFPLAA